MIFNVKNQDRTMIKLDIGLVRLSEIDEVDDTLLEKYGKILVRVQEVWHPVSGFFATELMWLLKPSSLEGRRFNWTKHSWSIHNLIAHPIMQILAYMRCYKTAMWLHDVTVPKPIRK